MNARTGAPIPLAQVQAAAATIAGHAVRTPVLTHPDLDAGERRVFCKAEMFQRAGAFKFRGALNRLSDVAASDRAAGVVAVSSGNHGAAVATAAQLLSMPAAVFIPEDAPSAKRRLIVDAGAEVHTFDRSIVDREAPARQLAAERGAVFVHPFEDPLVMTGQGTVALELFDDVGALDVLIVPMSGGGLMAGCASVAHALAPSCEIVGVEPSVADDTRRSFSAGRRITIVNPPTIADGLAVTAPGATTFEINRRLVDDVVTVSETAIVEAMRWFHELFGAVIEPSGAVGLAALAADPRRWRGRSVGIVLSGGNIDGARFAELTGIAP